MKALKIDDTQATIIYPFLKDPNNLSSSMDEASLRASMPLDLGQDLQLRFCKADDIHQAVTLFDQVWERESFRAWFEDLMSGHHPNARFEDFTVVEDRATGRLVSLMGLIS